MSEDWTGDRGGNLWLLAKEEGNVMISEFRDRLWGMFYVEAGLEKVGILVWLELGLIDWIGLYIILWDFEI